MWSACHPKSEEMCIRDRSNVSHPSHFAYFSSRLPPQLNVDYDGGLYDCEVNHVLGLPLDGPANVRDIVDEPLFKRHIKTSPICYSCAAGCGSSCGGSLLEKYAK